ncbi:protein of unknown function [Ferrimonas sediminum]|uniref:DUF4381 domain-containing protein n=1 Tax=Ferrimonas sediminum TaxID=718193 RepID=A0A1G8LA56_9GAMM|nr:DUF4381 domain-containing protein [Ferrimonas sediminum]SDI52513.1 protein of unknown function [Ferrimonas sediminum]
MAPDPLAQLRDIITEPAPWSWPLSISASLVLLALSVALGLGLVWVWHRHRHQRPLRCALQELQALPDTVTITDLSGLMKRTALCYYPREQVASLSGADWAQWLAQYQAPDHQRQWQQLQQRQYQANAEVRRDGVTALLTHTLKRLSKGRKPC